MTSARKRLASGLLLASLVLLFSASDAHALPAFARKYGLRCSACHEAWPMLNYFGQKFKDNGYQLMNDRDAPIWQNNGYWPVTMRITPSWHRESSDKVAIDTASGPLTGQQQITAHGFDVGGLVLLPGESRHHIQNIRNGRAGGTRHIHGERSTRSREAKMRFGEVFLEACGGGGLIGYPAMFGVLELMQRRGD